MRLMVTAPYPCSYLPEKQAILHYTEQQSISSDFYTRLLGHNFRHSGSTFYRPACPSCQLCQQLRVSVKDFELTNSYRRVIKRNTDLRIDFGDLPLSPMDREIYRRYVVQWHHQSPPGDDEIELFLGTQHVPGFVMRYYDQDRLIGIGFLDLAIDGLSTVYFAFDPAEQDRSLGVYSVCQEISWAKSQGLDWYYMGYWIATSPKMSYKANYKPCQILREDIWTWLYPPNS